jgi:HlyD family secretion protein
MELPPGPQRERAPGAPGPGVRGGAAPAARAQGAMRVAEPAAPTADEALDALLGAPPAWWSLRRARSWALLGLALAIAGAAVALLRPNGSGPPVHYRTEPVARGDLRVVVVAAGQLKPTRQVDISSELSGTVLRVLVEENDRVKRGQPLAELDTERLEAAVENSQARLRSAEARAQQARATLRQVARDRQRLEELASQQARSQKELDAARAEDERAAAALASAEAEVGVARAELRRDQNNLGKACICAPIDGVVLTRSVDPGQTVAASFQAPVLFTMAEDLTKLQAEVDVDEADVGMVSEGQSAHFTVDAYPERRFPARIRKLRLAPQTEKGVVTYRAQLAVDNPELLLRPGMTAIAEVEVQTVQGALLVPNAALRFRPPEPADAAVAPAARAAPPPAGDGETPAPRELWLLREGAPVSVSAVVGPSDGAHTQILSAQLKGGGELREGDAVIVDALDAPR